MAVWTWATTDKEWRVGLSPYGLSAYRACQDRAGGAKFGVPCLYRGWRTLRVLMLPAKSERIERKKGKRGGKGRMQNDAAAGAIRKLADDPAWMLIGGTGRE